MAGNVILSIEGQKHIDINCAVMLNETVSEFNIQRRGRSRNETKNTLNTILTPLTPFFADYNNMSE